MHKMLIVDDDWMISDSLKHMDEWLDMKIDVVGTAENGKEALFWLERENIDIILTDIRMPEMDGLELSKHIYDHEISTHIIIMSGFEDFQYAKEAIGYKVKGYLLKPIDMTELFDTVKLVQQEHLTTKEPISPKQENPESQTQQERIITSTLNYIHSNYMEPLTLRELADRVHLSEHYLGQLFKTVTGKSFLKYLTKVRMDMAILYLQNPVLKVYEISEKVGYTDPKHFMKVFKRTYNCTPKYYRQQLWNKSDKKGKEENR